MRLLRENTQDLITLDRTAPLGSGGEAHIYRIVEDASLVAKIYHEPTESRAAKLIAMRANPPEDHMTAQGHVSIAWPIDLLRSIDSKQNIVGFIMPVIKGHNPVFEYYTPRRRRERCPFFNYFYLHRAALNIAKAVRSIHACGHVIGDVNESNVLVSQTALASLVDTDSFQIVDPSSGLVRRCLVGKPEYTPPELQGINFKEFYRSQESDLFGLSILLFHLLNEGTHPFEGVYNGAGDPPRIEARIEAGHFSAGGTRSVPYQVKPLAPPFENLHPALQASFVQSFVEGHSNPKRRPTADEWILGLQQAEVELLSCTKNPSHRYHNHLRKCPWCERAAMLNGLDPFPAPPSALKAEAVKIVRPLEIQSGATVEQIIFHAITSRRLLEFSYKGGVRVVEPHILYEPPILYDGTNLRLLAWWVRGFSKSRHQPFWRNYIASGMTNIKVLDENFTGNRPGYDGGGISNIRARI